MKQGEYEDRIRELAFIFFAAPTVILVGMFAVGAIIDTFLHTAGTFSYLFSIIGGIPGVGMYYYREWKKFNTIYPSKSRIERDLEEIKLILKKLMRE